jgi:hypothetical protein
MNQNIVFICMLWASPKSNKSPKRFLSIEPAGLKYQVDPTLKIGWKVIKGDYVQKSVLGKPPHMITIVQKTI